MKTTIEIDDKRLRRVMTLTGIKTRRAAVEHCLRETERLALLSQAESGAWPAEKLGDVLDPHYDLAALRARERPRRS